MFKRILVPLDGSKLAEKALPAALYWAQRFNAALIFFHVMEQGGSTSIHGEHHLTGMDEAKAYLERLAESLKQSSIEIERHVHETKQANVPQSIIAHAQELHTDLIVLCAHGSGGLRDIFIGSIAQQVIQRGKTPVFFIRPEHIRGPFSVQKILVPLDRTEKHVSCLPIAVEVARACGAALRLMNIVATTTTLPPDIASAGIFLPSTMAAVLNLEQDSAFEYLTKVAGDLSTQGISCSGAVVRGDVSSEILAASDESDMIIMSTHARVNWEAFWEESVTPKVMAHANAPMLLLRS
jgi:nucleotide-binding universal stress UspA family protein